MGFSSAGTEQMVFDANGITLRQQNEIRFGDNDSSHYVAIMSSHAVGTSFTLKLPTAQGANGTYIHNDGSGNLSFQPATVIIGGTTINVGGNAASTISGLSSFGSTTVNASTLYDIVRKLPDNKEIEFIANDGRSFAIKTDGTLWCWGSSQHGSLGMNQTANNSDNIPILQAYTGRNRGTSGSTYAPPVIRQLQDSNSNIKLSDYIGMTPIGLVNDDCGLYNASLNGRMANYTQGFVSGTNLYNWFIQSSSAASNGYSYSAFSNTDFSALGYCKLTPFIILHP